MRTARVKIISIISCIALLALNALSLFTAPNDIHLYFTGASLAIALGLLVAIVLVRSEGAGPKSRTETAKPMPVPVASNQAEAEIISFLATLQERGRLIDFLMATTAAAWCSARSPTTWTATATTCCRSRYACLPARRCRRARRRNICCSPPPTFSGNIRHSI